MRLIETVPDMDGDYVQALLRKLSPPLVTLLSSEPEVQYVALRNINLVVQRRPDILRGEMKVCVFSFAFSFVLICDYFNLNFFKRKLSNFSVFSVSGQMVTNFFVTRV
jgi:vesicle coat complex subunit